MTYHTPLNLLRYAALLVAVSYSSTTHAIVIGFEAENGDSVTTTVTATIGADYLPADSDLAALGGQYLDRAGNGETGGFPGTAANLLSYDVNFAEAGEYDLYARLLFEVDGNDDSFYYGNGFGVKSLTDSADWVRPNGLPDDGFPAATYFWINLSENIGAFPSGTATTFNVAAPGTQTIQFGGREDGLYFDAFAFGTATDTFTDQQLNESVTNSFSPPNEWNLTGGGNFNTAANWSDNVVPTFDALFGASITQNAEIALDSPGPSLNSVTLNNTNFQYTLAGPNALNLVAAGQISTTGSHQITANVSGSVGLNKLGDGTLTLAGAKSYTGATNVLEGTLVIDDLDAIDNQASESLNIAAGATVNLDAGASGTLAAQLTGASTVDDDAVLRVTSGFGDADTLTINRSNAGYGGVIRVEGGTLAVGNSSALGDGGESNDRTVVQAGTTAKVALTGGVTIASELLDFEGRSTDAPGLTSSGNNAWNGVIRGEGNNTLSNLNIESTSGTLTLDELYTDDTGSQFTYVFSGAGNTTVTSRISDSAIDIGTGIIGSNDTTNVNVVKRGSGTLTIGYANADVLGQDYWFGFTSILEGTMVVSSSGGTDGELRSSAIEVESGATLDVSAFTEYTQQIGQAITGGGSINVGSGNLRLIDVSNLAPGDSPGKVGELTVTSGTVTLPDLSLGGGGAWSFDIGNTSNPASDLFNVQSGSFTASTSGITFNITPASGHLDAGSRTIVSHTGGTNAALNSATAQITDAAGNPLTTRQTVAVNGNTAGEVNVVVIGEEASRTWTGSSSSAWDVSSNNWQEGDQQFRDLDHVTFGSSATTKDVTLAANRAPGSVTFDNAGTYTFSGEGAIVGSGSITLSGTSDVTLANSGNSTSGDVAISSSSSLRLGSASTGSITNNGTLSLGTPETVNLLVQNGAEEIGTGAGYKVFAFEAEDFLSLTENAVGESTWTVSNTVPGSSGGEALYASEEPSNGDGGSVGGQNFVTYDMKFTEPGTYTWFTHMVSVDGGDGNSTPDGDAGNDDSFWAPSDNMDASNTDPGALGSRIENFGSGRINAEGTNSDPLAYDWYRNGHVAPHPNDEFGQIEVTQSDVDAGTVFSFKVGTREGGMTLDKFAFVAINDTSDFGTTLLDSDLDAASSIAITQETFTASGSILDINGDFTMTAGSELNMLISTPGTHDQLDISGALTAAGTLNVAAGGNGFSADAGDVFDIFRFDSVSGAFTIGSLPTLSLGLDWDTSNLLVTGELAVIAVGLPGDFNGDFVVDAADYTVWRDNLGLAEGDLLNGNGDGGTVTQSDYLVWKNNFGQSLLGSGSSASVPEPSSALCGLMLLGLVAAARRRVRIG